LPTLLPSTLALRQNVAFHSSIEDAEKAGFLACKRCSPVGRTLAQEHSAAVAKACRTIKQAEKFPYLNKLPTAVGMSPYHFHRVFEAITGLTPKAYANAHRSDRGRKALPQWQTVTEAIYESGFNSRSVECPPI
jgi:AraC family transcriptional regulator of adaptative response/methylated-DNA-[protein]-cysteine methyltransferase